jgi:uncharacterized membrane protein
MYGAKASISLDVNASVAWDYLSEFRNISTFLSHIREVKSINKDLWEWHFEGVLGIPLFCQTTLTRIENTKRVIWNSVEGPIATSGWIHVEALLPGSRITISLNYHPSTGVLSDVFQRMFENPQQILESDLQKLSHLITQPTKIYPMSAQTSDKIPR